MGKTSLVEVLEGLAAPTSGRVQLFGKDPIRDRRAVSPRTGIMLQEAGFAQDLTVGETLRMWAGTLTAPRPVRRPDRDDGGSGEPGCPGGGVRPEAHGGRRRAICRTGR